MHNDTHELAGQTVLLNDTAQDPIQHQVVPGAEFRIEDWWDKVAGKSWMFSDGNFAAMNFAMRSAGKVPMDDEVVYGKIGHLGHIVHISELGEVVG